MLRCHLFRIHIVYLGKPGEMLHVFGIQVFIVDALVSGFHPPHAGAAAHADGKELAGAAFGIPGGIVHEVADLVHFIDVAALDVAVAQAVHADIRPALVELAVRVDDYSAYGVSTTDVVPDNRIFVHNHIRIINVHQVIVLVFQETLLGETFTHTVAAVIVTDGSSIGNEVFQVVFPDNIDDFVHRVWIITVRVHPKCHLGNNPVNINDVFDDGVVGTLPEQ